MSSLSHVIQRIDLGARLEDDDYCTLFDADERELTSRVALVTPGTVEDQLLKDIERLEWNGMVMMEATEGAPVAPSSRLRFSGLTLSRQARIATSTVVYGQYTIAKNRKCFRAIHPVKGLIEYIWESSESGRRKTIVKLEAVPGSFRPMESIVEVTGASSHVNGLYSVESKENNQLVLELNKLQIPAFDALSVEEERLLWHKQWSSQSALLEERYRIEPRALYHVTNGKFSQATEPAVHPMSWLSRNTEQEQSQSGSELQATAAPSVSSDEEASISSLADNLTSSIACQSAEEEPPTQLYAALPLDDILPLELLNRRTSTAPLNQTSVDDSSVLEHSEATSIIPNLSHTVNGHSVGMSGTMDPLHQTSWELLNAGIGLESSVDRNHTAALLFDVEDKVGRPDDPLAYHPYQLQPTEPRGCDSHLWSHSSQWIHFQQMHLQTGYHGQWIDCNPLVDGGVLYDRSDSTAAQFGESAYLPFDPLRASYDPLPDGQLQHALPASSSTQKASGCRDDDAIASEEAFDRVLDYRIHGLQKPVDMDPEHVKRAVNSLAEEVENTASRAVRCISILPMMDKTLVKIFTRFLAQRIRRKLSSAFMKKSNYLYLVPSTLAQKLATEVTVSLQKNHLNQKLSGILLMVLMEGVKGMTRNWMFNLDVMRAEPVPSSHGRLWQVARLPDGRDLGNLLRSFISRNDEKIKELVFQAGRTSAIDTRALADLVGAAVIHSSEFEGLLRLWTSTIWSSCHLNKEFKVELICSLEFLLAINMSMERIEERNYYEVIGLLFKRVTGVVEKYVEANVKCDDHFRRLFADFVDTVADISALCAFQSVFGY